MSAISCVRRGCCGTAVTVPATVPVLRTASAIIAASTAIPAAARADSACASGNRCAHAPGKAAATAGCEPSAGNGAAIFSMRRDGIRPFDFARDRFCGSEHALFFGRGFLLLEFTFFGIFRVLFGLVLPGLVALVFFGVVVVVMFVHAGIGGCVGCGEDAILRIARSVVILRVGNVFGERRGFLFCQIHVGMIFVVNCVVMLGFVISGVVLRMDFRSIMHSKFGSGRQPRSSCARSVSRELPGPLALPHARSVSA